MSRIAAQRPQPHRRLSLPGRRLIGIGIGLAIGSCGQQPSGLSSPASAQPSAGPARSADPVDGAGAVGSAGPARWAPGASLARRLEASSCASAFRGISASGAAGHGVSGGWPASPDFSPTSTVRINVNTALGGLGYSGSAVEEGANRALGLPLLNALSFNHDTRLTLDTSFSGRDLLRLRLRAGNFGPSGFFSNPPTPLTRLDFAFEEPGCGASAPFCGRDVLSLNRAYLELPVAEGLRVSLGPRVMQVDLLPVWPSAYSASPILELFQRAGAAGAYSRRVGAGLGLAWQPRGRWKGVSIAYAAVAPQGGDGSPEEGGLFTGVGGQTNTLQLAYTRASWNLTATYTVTGQGALLRGTPLASQLAAQAAEGTLQSWGLAGYWQPARGGWIPSISAGWGLDHFAFARLPVPGLTGATSSSWSVGLQWSDVFGAGNNLMLALGSPARVMAVEGLVAPAPDEGGLALELAGQIRVSDGFSLTPALFWLPRPRGAMGGTTSLKEALVPAPGADQARLSVWGALLRTTLRF